jgi:TonB family protein
MIKTVFAVAMDCSLFIFSLQAQQSSGSVTSTIPTCPPVFETPLPDHMIRPVYPRDALRKRMEGSVTAQVVVAPDGKTRGIKVLDGDSSFSKNTVAAIHKWRFHPITREGRAVEAVYRVHVRFNPLLQEANSDVELVSPKPETHAVPIPPREHGEGSGDLIHRASESGIIPPKQLYSPEPEFSEEARKKNKPGVVDIALVVGSDGLPRDFRIACTSNPDLVENAIAAVRQWKFASGTKDGTPVSVEILVEISFRIN